MSRWRSRGAESQSVNRRMLLDGIVDEDVLAELAVRQRHLWPESVDNTKLAPGSVHDRHISPEVRGQLGKSTIEHVTAYAAAGQIVTAGGAPIGWATEAEEPTERRGFDTFHEQLQTGTVFAIPVNLTGLCQIIFALKFQDATSGVDLDATGVDCTVTVTRVLATVEADWPDHLYDTDIIGVEGPLTGWVENRDTLEITINPTENIKVSGLIYVDIWGVAAVASTVASGDLVDQFSMNAAVHGWNDGTGPAVGTATLQSGQIYTIALNGTWDNGDGSPYDAEFRLPSTESTRPYWSVDGGATVQTKPDPVGGTPASADADNLYLYRITGGGFPLQVGTTDSPISDNSGGFTVRVFDGDVAVETVRRML